MIFSKESAIRLLMLASLSVAPSLALSKEPWIGQVDFVVQQERYVSIGDKGFEMTPFTIVREYGAQENQRLPLSRLQSSNWVNVQYEFDENTGRNVLRVVELLSGESAAMRLMEENDF